MKIKMIEQVHALLVAGKTQEALALINQWIESRRLTRRLTNRKACAKYRASKRVK